MAFNNAGLRERLIVPPAFRDAAVPVVFAGLFLLFLLTCNFTSQQSVDIPATFLPAWELVHHGTFYVDEFADTNKWFIPVHEHVISNRMPGSIFWVIPFYGLFGRADAGPTLFAPGLAAVVASWLAMVVFYLLMKELTTRRAALATTLVLALATPTWTVSADGLWTHGPAQLAIASTLLYYARGQLVRSGLAQAAGILIRPHLAVVSICIGVSEALRTRRIRPLILVAVLSGLGVIALINYYRYLYGTWTLLGGNGELGGQDRDAYTATPKTFLLGLVGIFISPGKGAFIYTPFLLCLIPGIGAAWRASPAWVRTSFVAALAYTVVQVALKPFTGGGGSSYWPYRLMIEPITLAAPLLFLSFDVWLRRTRHGVAVFWALVAWSTAWISAAAVTYVPLDYMPHPWTSSAYDDIVTARPGRIAACLLVAAGAWLLWFVSASRSQDSETVPA